MTRKLPVWRSLLFVPVNVERYVEKAHERGADAIQLDLEDSVPLAEKAHARTLVAEAAARVRRGGADVVVRINRPWRMALRDLEASVGPDVDAIALPKVAGAQHVRLVAEVLDELERERGLEPGRTKLICMIETADAFFHAHEVAAAPRGSCRSASSARSPTTRTSTPTGRRSPARAASAFAARAASIRPRSRS
jgi:citrate lyase subunit beta/citryl-CoA lyase